MRRAPILSFVVAGALGGVVIGAIYPLVTIAAPLWILRQDHPQFVDPVALIPAYLMVGSILGIPTGAAAGALSGVAYAFAPSRHRWAEIVALAVGPLATSVAAFFLLIQYDPNVSGWVFIAIVTILGSGGFLIVAHPKTVGQRLVSCFDKPSCRLTVR